MAISFVNVGAKAEGSAPASLTPVLPSGVTTNDIVIAFCGHGATTAPVVTDAAWATLASGTTGSGGAGSWRAVWRRKDISWSAAPVFTASGGGALTNSSLAVCVAYRGALKKSNPFRNTGITTSSVAGQPSMNSITTTYDNSEVIAGWFYEDDIAHTAWSSSTGALTVNERADVITSLGSMDAAVGIGSGTLATAGATGAIRSTFTGTSDRYGGFNTELIEEPSAPSDLYGKEIYDERPLFYWRLGGHTAADTRDYFRLADMTAVNGPLATGSPIVQNALAGSVDNEAATSQRLSDNGVGADLKLLLDGLDEFTFEAWCQLESLPTGITTNARPIIEFNANDINQNGIKVAFGLVSGNLRLSVALTLGVPGTLNTSRYDFVPPVPIEVGKIYHVVVRLATSGTLKLTMNGLDAADANVGTTDGVETASSPSASISLGRSQVTIDGLFDGLLQEVAFYDYELTPAAVRHHFNLGARHSIRRKATLAGGLHGLGPSVAIAMGARSAGELVVVGGAWNSAVGSCIVSDTSGQVWTVQTRVFNGFTSYVAWAVMNINIASGTVTLTTTGAGSVPHSMKGVVYQNDTGVWKTMAHTSTSGTNDTWTFSNLTMTLPETLFLAFYDLLDNAASDIAPIDPQLKVDNYDPANSQMLAFADHVTSLDIGASNSAGASFLPSASYVFHGHLLRFYEPPPPPRRLKRHQAIQKAATW